MNKEDLIKSRISELLSCLLENSRMGMVKIAEKIGINRKTAWLLHKDLEKNKVIWGYTTVVDQMKLEEVVYFIQFKTKPLTKEFADLIIKRLVTDAAPLKIGVRIIDIYFLHGDYDVLIKFSAPNHEIAWAYCETLRIVYKDHFLETPQISDAKFVLAQCGKVNPDLKTRLYDFVPKEF